jgi:hypothetical protein
MLRGAVTVGGTFTGGIFHTLPFLIPGYGAAVSAAIIVVACELLTLAYLRHKFFQTSFARSFVAVTVDSADLLDLVGDDLAELSAARLPGLVTRPCYPPSRVHREP